MAHTYSHFYDILESGLRFFTVYGPMGCSDMAYFGFTNELANDESIKLGDVPAIYASTDKLYNAVGFKPTTPIEKGLQTFIDWYVDYYKNI